MITIIPNDNAAPAAINAIADPKHVWLDGNVYRIFTGEDMPLPIAGPRVISAQEFRDRFSAAAMDAVIGLAYGGDVLARRLLLELQTNKTGIDLDSPKVTGALAYMVSKLSPVLTAADANKALA